MAASQSSADGEVFAPALEPGGSRGRGYRRPFASVRVILALILREMSTRYVRTPGGYVWAVLEPVGFVALLSVAFSLMARTPPLGTSFLLFYASGFLPFSFYGNIEGDVSSALRFSRPLLLYPSVTWLDALLARLILGTITGSLVIFFILGGSLLLTGHRASVDLVPVVEAVLAAGTLGFGIGTLNSYLHGAFPLVQTFWKIATRPLFLLSGVIFTLEDLPTGLQHILWWNPLIHITGLMRAGIYPNYQPHYISMPYVYGIALFTAAMGLLFLRAFSRDLVNKT